MVVVQVHESAPSRRFASQDLDKRYRVLHSYWRRFVPSKADFVATSIVAGKAERRPIFVRTRKKSRQAGYKQMVAPLRELLLDQEWSIWQHGVATDARTTIAQKIVKELQQSITATPVMEIVYENRELIEALLGDQGKYVLGKVITLIGDLVQGENLPLSRVEVHHVKDLEAKDWQYVLLVLFLNSDFDTANRYLYDFYKKLDILTDTLNDEERDILQRMLFFDVGSTLSNA